MSKAKKESQSAQSARFIEAARELGRDESLGAFEAAVKKVARHKPTEKKSVETPSKPTLNPEGR